VWSTSAREKESQRVTRKRYIRPEEAVMHVDVQKMIGANPLGPPRVLELGASTEAGGPTSTTKASSWKPKSWKAVVLIGQSFLRAGGSSHTTMWAAVRLDDGRVICVRTTFVVDVDHHHQSWYRKATNKTQSHIIMAS
jgi:hypothetical protein